MDIMLSSHISIVSHIALFRFLWFRLFCFVLPCCVILCFGGIKPPWGGFIPPKGVVLTRGGGFIPHKGWLYPPKGVVLSPQRGGFIPHKSGNKTTRGGFKGGFIPHLGVVLCPGPQGNQMWVLTPIVLACIFPKEIHGHGITLVPLGAIMCVIAEAMPKHAHVMAPCFLGARTLLRSMGWQDVGPFHQYTHIDTWQNDGKMMASWLSVTTNDGVGRNAIGLSARGGCLEGWLNRRKDG